MTRERIVLAITTVDSVERDQLMAQGRSRSFRRFIVRDTTGLTPGPEEEIYQEAPDRFVPVGREAAPSIPLTRVATPEQLARALEDGARSGAVAIRWTGDRIIPLENAIAQRPTPVTLWVVADQVDDVPAALGALEHGADRVVVSVDDAGALDLLESRLELFHTPSSPWELAVVRRSAPAGMGDRVLVDTTSLLRADEGILVGSVAGFLFLVTSEAEGSAFSRPRPFRVNAGTAHSYVLLADGTTRYLSELEAGDALLAADPANGFRSVRVGRLKVERRPIRLVEAERGGRGYTVFLQDAETVRLAGETGRLSMTRLSPGDRVFGLSLPEGRHLGVAVEETVDER